MVDDPEREKLTDTASEIISKNKKRAEPFAHWLFEKHYSGKRLSSLELALRRPGKFFQSRYFQKRDPLGSIKSVTVTGDTLLVDPRDYDGSFLYFSGILFPPEWPLIDFLIRVVSPQTTFWDFGASYGFFSSLAARLGAVEVVAIEPNPERQQSLRALCELHPSMRLVPVMVADEDEDGSTLYVPQGHSGGASMTVPTGDFETHPVTKQSVSTFRVDNPPVGESVIAKLDVEGAEALILPELLNLLDPIDGLIIMEHHFRGVHAEASHAALELVRAANWETFAINPNGDIQPVHDEVNQTQSASGARPSYTNLVLRRQH